MTPGPLAPGATIGILGGGQLGRMLAMAAAGLGLKVHVLAPESEAVAAEVAARFTCADYDDRAALTAFARGVDVITCEFENVPAAALAHLATLRPVRPGAHAFEIAQDRVAEKRFVEALGGRTAPFLPVDSPADLMDALDRLGTPAILKTRRLGYDGKGQARIDRPADAQAALSLVGGPRDLLLEGFVPFTGEFSILLARGIDGSIARWPAIANRHAGGILVRSEAPARDVPPGHVDAASELAARIAGRLDYVGVLACEFFACADGPRFNEMAPRVHNSGHWTIEGALTSQFEQHVRAIAGLPLGATDLVAGGAEMHNLLGEEALEAYALLARPGVHLHLYGKADAAPGRKMGHVTRLLPWP